VHVPVKRNGTIYTRLHFAKSQDRRPVPRVCGTPTNRWRASEVQALMIRPAQIFYWQFAKSHLSLASLDKNGRRSM
jgi:hypothetical protein